MLKPIDQWRLESDQERKIERPMQPCLNEAYDENLRQQGRADEIGRPRLLYCPCPKCNPFRW